MEQQITGKSDNDTGPSLLVIGACPSRTGTMSLRQALLTLLGGSCMHFQELMLPRRADIKVWVAAVERGRLEKSEATQVLRGCTVCLDLPAAAFYADLMEHYPDALVLLSVRDANSWASSIRATVMYSVNIWDTLPVCLLRLFGVEPAGRLMRASFRLAFGVPLEPSTTDAELAAAYLAYNQRVRDTVPPHRLLEYRLGDGWPPLCQRLGLPLPGRDFPRLNDTRIFRLQGHALYAAGVAAKVAPAVVAVALAGFAAWWVTRPAG